MLLQDYTGIPAVADLAAMREAVKEKNKDPNTINPLSAVDLVIDIQFKLISLLRQIHSTKMLKLNLIEMVRGILF